MYDFGKSSSYSIPWWDEDVRSGITEIVIENGVKNIGEYAFTGLGPVKKVTVPDSVKSIGMRVFHGCELLEDINIPEGVT